MQILLVWGKKTLYLYILKKYFDPAQGSMLGVIPSLIITIFIGVGSIVAGNAKNLPNQKLPLRQDGCYVNSTDLYSTANSFFSSPMVKSEPEWKQLEYSGLNNFLGVSYLWHPLITVVTTVVFGLIFSFIINKYKKSKPVKVKYLTPVVLKFWVKVLGKERLEGWVDFVDEEELELENNNGGGSASKLSTGNAYGSFENISSSKKSLT